MRPARAVALLILFLTTSAGALDPAARLPMVEGLDALESARYADATAAFSRAIEADSEDDVVFLARAVSKALAEDPVGAEKDLLRAQKLNPQDKHVRLWLAFTYMQRGDFMKSSMTYPAATRDPYENLVSDTGRAYGVLAAAQARNARDAQSGTDPEWIPKTDKEQADRVAALKKFPEVAAAFAGRVKGTIGDLGPVLADRARKLMEAREWAAALSALEKVQQTRPTDLDVLQDRATCNLNLGAPAAAREQYTRVLTADPTRAAAFAGRARAAQVLEDTHRAASDFQHAARLDPAGADAYGQEASCQRAFVAIDRDQVPTKVRELYEAARGNATEDDLVARATAIIRSVNAYRLRADETYFDQRLRLELAAKDGSPDALADLGEFLYREATARHAEAVEPRAPMRAYRPRDEAAELAYAERACDRALAAKPDHVKALTYKALVLMARGQWADAEAPLKRALAIDPTYGPLLDGSAKLLSHAAAVRAGKAARLRQTTSWEDTHYYYWRHPSQAELDQADALDRQAQQLWALARVSLEAAAKLHAGKPLGFYYAGIIASHENRAADAQAAFEECVKLDPTFQSAWDELAVIYAARGMGREAAEAKSRSVNLVHTTAGHMLRYAWGNIPRTKFKTARQALESAIAYDPADPRSCAYLGVIAAADEQPEAALGWFRAAAALDEARAVLNGTSLRSTALSLVPAQSAGFTLSLNNRLGAVAVGLNRHDVAAEAYRRNIALERRIPRGEWFTPLAVSMLPDTDPGELGNVPEADAAVSLLMEARTGAGESLAKQGRRDEAAREFRASLAMPDLRHPTQEPIYRVGEPALRAKIGILRMMMADKQWVAAEKELQSGSGWQGHPTKATTEEYRKLGEEIQRQANIARQAQSDEEAEAFRRRYTPPPTPPRRRPAR